MGHNAGVITPGRRASTVLLASASLVAAALAATVVGPAVAADRPTTTQARTATTPAKPTTPAEQRIADLVPDRLADPRLGSTVSVQIIDARSGRSIVTQRTRRPMLPASNMKVVTAMAALQQLGADYRFTTRVVQGPLGRQVFLVGGGDPILTSSQLAELADDTATALIASGDTSITLLIDDSLYPTPTNAPGWPDDYVPDVVRPIRALTLWNLVSMDTSAYVGAQFADMLRTRGITVTTGGRGIAPDSGTMLASYAGNRLDRALGLILPPSNNDATEILARHIAIDRGLPPTWDGTSMAIMQVLEELGVPTAGIIVADGSGLSRNDRLTTRTLIALLQLASRRGVDPFDALIPSLPVSGETGTLASRYRWAPSACAAGEIRAKTGTLFDTVALSGVTRGDDGRLRIFSILVNNRPQSVLTFDTREAVDALAATVNGCY